MPVLTFTTDTSRFVKNLVGQFSAMRYAALHAIDESANEFIDEMRKRIESNSPSGRTYFHRGDFRLSMKPMEGGEVHIASAPGEPPAVLSGELLRSFSKRTFFSRGHTRIISYIENDAPYALYMEYGTSKTGWGGPIDPRPFMAPVIYSAELNHRMLMRVRRLMEVAGQGYGAR